MKYSLYYVHFLGKLVWSREKPPNELRQLQHLRPEDEGKGQTRTRKTKRRKIFSRSLTEICIVSMYFTFVCQIMSYTHCQIIFVAVYVNESWENIKETIFFPQQRKCLVPSVCLSNCHRLTKVFCLVVH